MRWNKYKGGRGWYRHEDGSIVADALPDGGFEAETLETGVFRYRSKGDPITAWNALLDFGADFREASDRFDVPIPVLFGMMAIEAHKQKNDRTHFDPRSLRLEPDYLSDEKTPEEVSPGLMQTLLSTARQMNRKFRLFERFDGELELLEREDLFVPRRSILLGAAYMRHQIDRVEDDELGFDADDPVLLCSAYNAGSVRETARNDWNLLTYGAARMDKFIAYHNDMVFVLSGRCSP